NLRLWLRHVSSDFPLGFGPGQFVACFRSQVPKLREKVLVTIAMEYELGGFAHLSRIESYGVDPLDHVSFAVVVRQLQVSLNTTHPAHAVRSRGKTDLPNGEIERYIKPYFSQRGHCGKQETTNHDCHQRATSFHETSLGQWDSGQACSPGLEWA